MQVISHLVRESIIGPAIPVQADSLVDTECTSALRAWVVAVISVQLPRSCHLRRGNGLVFTVYLADLVRIGWSFSDPLDIIVFLLSINLVASAMAAYQNVFEIPKTSKDKTAIECSTMCYWLSKNLISGTTNVHVARLSQINH